MNNGLNQAVIKATGEIFKSVLDWSVQSSTPVEKPINASHQEVSVIISFVGTISGAITLKCSGKLATEIASQMLGMDVEEGSDDMKDAIGEMLNMVVGSAKTNYSTGQDPFKMSVPTIIIGEDYTVHIKANNGEKISLLGFKCQNNDMHIEVYLS